jgi:hypothetical protein
MKYFYLQNYFGGEEGGGVWGWLWRLVLMQKVNQEFDELKVQNHILGYKLKLLNAF